MGATTPWTRDAVAHRILDGDNLIVYRGNLLRIPPSWLDAHPGGVTAILHFVGHDATDEIEAVHNIDTLTDGLWDPLVAPIDSGWVRKRGPSGKLQWYNEAKPVRSTENNPLHLSSEILLYERDPLDSSSAPTLQSILPPPTSLSPKVQARQAAAFRQLHQRVIDAGLYKTPYLTGYGPEFIRYTLLATISAYAYRHEWYITSALFLGLFWHQLIFIAHDLGHMGVTHDWAIDRVISIIIADFIGGLSIGWWVEKSYDFPPSDPDIQHLPFFAISPIFFSSVWSSYYKRVLHFDRFAKVLIAVQHKLFYIVLAFARFNLYANSYIFLAKKAFDTKRARGAGWAWPLEIVGLITFWIWFSRVLRGCPDWQTALAYLAVSHIATSPVHVQIVLSHFSMSVADFGPVESFVHRQMRTTTDVICPESIDFIHGGLHLQVTHHLFPRLPRHNLKKASVFVKEFAEEHGLTYAEFGFVEGNQEVIGVLRDVALQVKLIGKVASTEAKEAVEMRLAEADQRWKQKVN
ncbi:delta 8-sphingoloid desaturase protein [Cyathus striatus]|nr:delta 8-sphingoloid desaturase protein [Cyathus striatus]